MKQGYFITGTDTGVGKTWLTLGLMDYFKRQKLTVAGMKPVAAGCQWQQGGWKNEDALLLQTNASVELPYALINPYAYQKPVSPHLASGGEEIDIDRIRENLKTIGQQVDVVVVEGAGGWYSPLSDSVDNRLLAESLQLPVIVVVAIRLGCINQALLTWRAINQSRLECAGWVAIQTDPNMNFVDENVLYIQEHISDVPLLGVVPFQQTLTAETISQEIKGFY